MNQEYTDYYESNLKLLKKNQPSVWKQITEDQTEALGEISFAPNGKPNLTVTNGRGNSILLHNEGNPGKESSDFIEKIPADHKGFVAILGMGLFYSALNILKQRPHLQNLALFELETGIFIQALQYIDLSPILEDHRLILGIGAKADIAETLTAASRTLQLEDSNILHHLPSFRFNPDGYNRLKDDLFAHINSLNIGGTTTRLLGKDFLTNRFKHICTIHHHLLLEHIQNKFDGVPAILVAGGPSLDKNIHLLKQAQEKAVIIAVDTVLPALLKNGVHPHFLTCIDPNNLTFEKFADVIQQVKDIALICSSWVNPKTPKVFPAEQIFWTFTGKPIEAWLNSLLGGKLLTGGASTVAHLNLIAAHMLGCDPIIFIGQDLAYPGSASASHAKGTVLQGTAPTKIITNHVQGETVTGINGEILQTNRSFLSMKEFFEYAIAKSDKTHINATEGGANIEGTKILTLQETMDQYCNKFISTTQRLKAFYSASTPIASDKMLVEFNRILSKTKKLQKFIKSSDEIARSLLKELTQAKRNSKLLKSFDMLTLPQKKRINKIDKFHKDLDDTLEVWKILEEITMEGLKESQRQKQDISILENDPDRYIEWLIKNLNRLLGINKIRKETLTLLSDNLNMVASFHQKESNYLEKINKGSQTEQNKLKLAGLYINSKNYYLATYLLEDLCKVMPESGEVYFYLGCSVAQSNILEKADHYFQTAIECDPKLSRQIDAYLHEMGDDFLKFARYFKTQPGRELSVKYMVQKGLRYHPDNRELQKELETILREDLKQIKSDVDTDNYQNSAELINEWYRNAMDQKNLCDTLPSDLA
ncbi:MAG: motility associated factor glycosyltransferase family protein, partial [Acetobacterium sp.]|nr:motility associated factor glycosyltransferase family protein [Acetobacterium sp.]